MAIEELISANPRISIVIISLAISLLITIVNYFFTDREKMLELKNKQKDLNNQIKEHRKEGRQDKVEELTKQLLPIAGEMMKHSLKPTLITLVPIIVLFGIIRNFYASTEIANTWFWYYLVGAIAGSMVFRKLFKMP